MTRVERHGPPFANFLGTPSPLFSPDPRSPWPAPCPVLHRRGYTPEPQKSRVRCPKRGRRRRHTHRSQWSSSPLPDVDTICCCTATGCPRGSTPRSRCACSDSNPMPLLFRQPGSHCVLVVRINTIFLCSALRFLLQGHGQSAGLPTVPGAPSPRRRRQSHPRHHPVWHRRAACGLGGAACVVAMGSISTARHCRVDPGGVEGGARTDAALHGPGMSFVGGPPIGTPNRTRSRPPQLPTR